MRVRCPNCHDSTEVNDNTELSNIVCPSCGSQFSLVGDETLTYTETKAKTIGHFELVDQIGTGAFGSVWMARDTQLDRSVAVKIPRKGQLDASETEQFVREARAAAQLKHPNIVAVHEVGREDGEVYIVSDYVEGLTLAEWLVGQQLTSRTAAELCVKIAEALHHAHEAGVIHRDLKPTNIIIDRENEPHIMDFGLAKREAGEVTMTMEGKVLGTPAYMSPEQAKGEAHHADRRSDVYSIGVILYELLTGHKPFRGNVRMLLQQVINDDPPSPRRLNSSIPRDLDTPCLKCLEKDPRKRYSTAKELSDELKRFLQGEPIQARPITALARAWRWCKRNPTVAVLASSLVLVLLAGLVGVASQWFRAEQLAATESILRVAAEEERDRSRRLQYAAELDVALQAWRSANVERVRQLLQRHRPRPEMEDLRGFEWYYLWRLFERSRSVPSLQFDGPVYSLTFSPDGKSLAVGTHTDLGVWNTDDYQRPVLVKPTSGARISVAFSPDSNSLAVGSANRVEVWDLTAATSRPIRNLEEEVGWVAFSPVDNLIAFAASLGKAVSLWNLDTGKHHDLPHASDIHGAAFSPDGKTIATACADHTVYLWTESTSEWLPRPLKGHSSPVYSVAFSPGGSLLASSSDNKKILLWDVTTGRKLRVLQGHGNRVTQVVFSPDGERLASASSDNTVRIWNVSSGKHEDTLIGHSGTVNSVGFSHDGNLVASGSEDGSVRIWNVAADRPKDVLFGHSDIVRAVAFSPDGGYVASGGHDRTIKIWMAATGALVHELESHSDTVRSLAFSPDGELLASGSWDKTISLWSTNTWQRIDTQAGHTQAVWAVAFSHDGKRLASGGRDQTIGIWNLQTKEWQSLPGHTGPVLSVAFSPQASNTLASGGVDGVVRLWDLNSRKSPRRFPGHTNRVHSLAFSPDGDLLASGSDDQTIRIWDISTEETRHVLSGHTNFVFSVAFSPDGKQLVSGSTDGTIRIWDVTSGQERGALLGHEHQVNAVAFSSDGLTVASAGSDRTVRLWRAASRDAVLAAGW